MSLAGSTQAIQIALSQRALPATGIRWDGVAQDNFVSMENAIGSAFNDLIFGDSANNILEGGSGSDYLDGGAGSDTVSFAGSTQAIQVELGALGTTGHGYSWDGVAQDSFTGMENAMGSAFNDLIFGDSANNILEGGLGSDYLDGGAGSDTVSFAGSTQAIQVKLGALGTQAMAIPGMVWPRMVLRHGECIGSAFSDLIFGDGANNILEGGSGSDYLVGGSGSDTVSFAGSTQAIQVELGA